MARAQDEYALQRYVVDLLRFTALPGVLWFHCPNGEYRSPRTGARLKAMGVRPGVADLIIIVRGIARFLELKADKGRQSAEQRAFEEDATDAGCNYIIVRSPEAARNILEIWRAIPGASGSVARRAA